MEDILDGCHEPDAQDQAFTMLQQPMQQEVPAFTSLDGRPLGLTEPVPALKDFSLPPSSLSPEHDDFNLADHIIEDPELLLNDETVDLMSEGDDLAELADFLTVTFPETTDDDDTSNTTTHSNDQANDPVKDPEPTDHHILGPMPPSHETPPAMGEWQKLLLEQLDTAPANTQATPALLPQQPMIGQPQTQATQAEPEATSVVMPEQLSRSRHQRPAGAWKRAPTYPHYHLSHANSDSADQGNDQAPSSMHQVRNPAGHSDCCMAEHDLKVLTAHLVRMQCTSPTKTKPIRLENSRLQCLHLLQASSLSCLILNPLNLEVPQSHYAMVISEPRSI